jgi:hypothetical protein
MDASRSWKRAAACYQHDSRRISSFIYTILPGRFEVTLAPGGHPCYGTQPQSVQVTCALATRHACMLHRQQCAVMHMRVLSLTASPRPSGRALVDQTERPRPSTLGCANVRANRPCAQCTQVHNPKSSKLCFCRRASHAEASQTIPGKEYNSLTINVNASTQ